MTSGRLSRRQAIGSIAIAGIASPGISLASPLDERVDKVVDLNSMERIPTLDELLKEEMEMKGTDTPYPDEVSVARRIIAACPRRLLPIDVAKFFLNLKAGRITGLDPSAGQYCEEWPVRANPLIVSFFDATSLRKPNGDQTAWCAAFVNWCIIRADNGVVGTDSAASATFREWNNKTDKPERGDIVVFRHKRDPARGHVGFFVSSDSEGFFVLGGNQMPARARLPSGSYEQFNTGEINVSWYPKDGSALEFASCRTHNGLRKVRQKLQ